MDVAVALFQWFAAVAWVREGTRIQEIRHVLHLRVGITLLHADGVCHHGLCAQCPQLLDQTPVRRNKMLVQK